MQLSARPVLIAEDTLADVIANVRANEAVYKNIEVLWSSELQRPDLETLHPQSFGRHPDVLLERHEECRYVCQDGMFYFELKGSMASSRRETPQRHRVRGFDGRVTRYLQHRGEYVANIIQGPASDYGALRPHILPLREQWVNVPLSTWLQGPDAIRAHPDGKMKENTDLQIEYAGEEEVQGLTCVKVIAEYWQEGEEARVSDHRVFWLATERNYLPVKAVGYRHFDSPDIPIEKTDITEIQEIEPGVWYPSRVVHTLYDSASIRENHSAVVSLRIVHTVEKVELDPEYPVSLFRDIKFPDGTPVYEVDQGEIKRSWRQGAPEAPGGPTAAVGSRWSWLLWANGAALAIVAAVLLVRRSAAAKTASKHQH